MTISLTHTRTPRVVVRYNKSITANQWIKEGMEVQLMRAEAAIDFGRTSGGFWLTLVATNLGNQWPQK